MISFRKVQTVQYRPLWKPEAIGKLKRHSQGEKVGLMPLTTGSVKQEPENFLTKIKSYISRKLKEIDPPNFDI